MTRDEQDHTADDWAQQALERLRQDGLEPMPENFAVYYKYFSGADPNLKMAMDLLFDKFGSLSQQQCTELFQIHLGLEAEHRVLQQTNTAIESELSKVMGVIDQSLTGATEYNQTLNSFSGTIQAAPTMDEIRGALTKVAQETRVMVDQNKRLQNQLAKSTEQLTEVRYSLDQVRKDSLVDPLTEIGNRKYFNNELARATLEASENKTDLALLMIDIDHFKKFNDNYGHLIGDQVLRLVAHTLVENLKGRDIIARYGGEEFVIMLPQTRVGDAEKVANQLRNVLATKQIQRKRTGETLGIVTISIGVTGYYPHEDPEGFIARADTALYEAKETGRNKVVVRIPSAEEVLSLQPVLPDEDKVKDADVAQVW
ncbi:MAG: GGDEF domain-containing protein [Alphaproteobacteria bacterium]|nr:GGDEF domain-containing protein [Alphaproteobacteria bacterium]